MSTLRGRWIATRRNYWSTKSSHEVAFQARYLELILDNLMRALPADLPWSRHARKHLDRSREAREKQVWRGVPPVTEFLTEMGDLLRDEAIWSVGRTLDQLYSTQEFGSDPPEPMLVADDRYFLHRASAALPAPEARAVLTLRAWGRILNELADTVYVDVGLWAAQVTKPELTVGDLIEGLTKSLKDSGTARRKEGDEHEWKAVWGSFQERIVAALGSRLGQSLGGLNLAEVDAFVCDVVGEAPQPFIPKGYARVRSFRLQALGEALEGISEALPEAPTLDDPFPEYLALEGRRYPIEHEATDEVRRRIAGASFDVILPVRVAVTAKLPVSFAALGFELAEDPGLDLARKAPGVLYARFTELQATGTDHAVEKARLRVRLALARAGMFVRGIVGFEILDAFIRYAGAQMWGAADRGWQIRGPTLSDEAFAEVTDIANLLAADDELAVRTQEAIVHLHCASVARDSGEAFDEAWRVLEILTGKASSGGASLIAYFPLMRAPLVLKTMRGAERDAFVKSQYRENCELFRQILALRNQGAVHRTIARADWHVLELHAAVAISFARDAVALAITAWMSPTLAVRDRTALVKWLDAAYKTLGVTLPKQSDLSPD